MKLVVVSDTHGDKETLGVSRAPEVERAMWQSAKYAIEAHADAWIHCGDLCDPDSGGATLRAQACAIEIACALANAGIRSIWVAGNHDCEDGGLGATTLTPLSGVEKSKLAGDLVCVAETPRLVWVDDELSVACLPFTPVARAYDPAAEARRLFAEAGRTRVVTASHLMVPGIEPGEETLEMPRGRNGENVTFPFEETQRAAFRLQGHYHTRRDFDPGDGGPPIHVIGSIAAFSFGPEAEGPPPAFSVIEL